VIGNRLRALAIPYAGPVPGGLRGLDLDGEYFSERTDVGLDRDSVIPVLWHHDLDPTKFIRGEIGKACNWRQTPDGWLADIDLDDDRAGVHAIRMLSTFTPLYVSTSAYPAFVERDGPHLRRWRVKELSLTTSPQNVLAVAVDRSDP
jgi:hypothetical protein